MKTTQQYLSFIFFVTLLVGIFLPKTSRSQFSFDYPGAINTYITGINNSGVICGYAQFADGVTKGFVKTLTDTIMVNYCDIPTANTWMGGVNDLGQVVGRYNEDIGTSYTFFPFIYNYLDGTCTLLTGMFGYEFISPNDINNQGWISGDLKDGTQRRVFTYHPVNGMNTNKVMVGNTIMPTYGGHHINENGNATCYWIEGLRQRGGRYFSLESTFDTTSFPEFDFYIEGVEKINLKGGNEDYNIILYYPQSRTTFIGNLVEGPESWGYEIYIPHATEVWGMDINDSGLVAGYYADDLGRYHGFYQLNIDSDFKTNVDGFRIKNSAEDLWTNWDHMNTSYFYDPYWPWEDYAPFPKTSDFVTYNDDSWIPWKDWVRAYGEEQCYHFAPTVNFFEISQLAFDNWRLFRKDTMDFEGAGFGMCLNAWYVKQNVDSYYAHYPETQNLFYLQPPGQTELGVSGTWLPASMRSAQAQLYSKEGIQSLMTPLEALTTQGYDNILENLVEISKGIVGVYPTPITDIKPYMSGFWSFLGVDYQLPSKTVIPTKLKRDPDSYNRFHLYYYDPALPLDTTQEIMITYTADSAKYVYVSNGVELQLSKIKTKTRDYSSLTEGSYPTLFTIANLFDREGESCLGFLGNPNLYISSSEGGELVVNDEIYTNSIEGSESLNPFGGYGQRPYLFFLNVGEYDATVTTQGENVFEAWTGYDKGSITYIRGSAEDGDQDRVVSSGNKFTYVNDSGGTREIRAKILTNDGDTEISYYVDNINVESGQDIGLSIVSPTQVRITSEGAATTYNARIRIFNPEVGFWETSAGGINIGNNVTQLIIPSLTDDTMDGIIIQTDADQDGNYEDSTAYDNEGIPLMMLSDYQIEVPNSGASETIYVSNVGGGNLDWTVVSSPSWIEINSGATGVNHGPIEFTVEENTTSSGRQDYIIIHAAAPSTDIDSLLIIQGEGIEVAVKNEIDTSDLSFSVMPNPAQGVTQIALNQEVQGKLFYTIYNDFGQIVRRGAIRGQKEILNISEMSSGVYYVAIQLSGKVMVEKLVVGE